MSDILRILDALQAGEEGAADRLLPLVYDELRRLAGALLAGENAGQTLDATGLVHEAYLRLMGPGDEYTFDNRRHFFAAAAEAMRRILIDNARRKRRLKHGGNWQRVPLRDQPAPCDDDRLLALDEALSKLAVEDPQAARVAELRHFAGLGHERIAAVLGVTVYEARRKWTYARAWLRHALGE